MTKIEKGKGEAEHDQGNLKNRKGKQKKGLLPPFNQIPLGTVFHALEGLRKEERLSYWHQEWHPGDFITGEVKRKPQFFLAQGHLCL